MTDDVTVRVTLGRLGDGEKTIELEPGESLSETFSDPSYVEVRALEVETDGGIPEPSDTTYEESEADGGTDREWSVKTVQCANCGDRYPKDYSRCRQCGTPNTSK